LKRKSDVFSNTATNLALGTLIISVGFACLIPVGGTAQTIAKENVYRSANADTGAVSVMFNVYWGTDEVYRILDILEKKEAKSTFFIGGSWADDNVECLQEIVKRGHELGNHGYFHKDHKKLGETDNRKEIVNCNEFIRLSTDVTPTLFAPPSGSYGKIALDVAEKLNMKTVLWTKDTIDWRDKDSTLIYTRATKNISGGDFVLMHPNKETVDALSDILDFYQEKGLQTVTVSENIRIAESL
jgi:peptidoglycan/xylan/chitin deacetylase (PgdA/CDA1 family)